MIRKRAAEEDGGDARTPPRSTSWRRLWLCFLFVFVVLVGILNVYLTELTSDLSSAMLHVKAARGGHGSVRKQVAVVFCFFGSLTSAYLPILKLVIGSIRATAPNERTARVPIVIMFDERNADAVAVARELRRLPHVHTRIVPHITSPYVPKNRPDLKEVWVKLNFFTLFDEFEQIMLLDGDMLVTSGAFHATLRPLPAPVTFATSRKGMRQPNTTQWWTHPFNIGIIVHRPSLSFARGMFASLNAYSARTEQHYQMQSFLDMFVQERGCYAGELAIVPEHSVANVSLRTPRTLDELHDMHQHAPVTPLHRSAFARTPQPSPPSAMALVLSTRSHPEEKAFPRRTKNDSYPLCGPLAAHRLPCIDSDGDGGDHSGDTSAANLITRGDERNCAMEPLYYAYLSIDLNMYIALAPGDTGLPTLARAAAARHTLGVLHWPGLRKPWRKEDFTMFPITWHTYQWHKNDYERCATWLWMLALDAWCPPAPREGAAPPPPLLAARRLRAAAGPCDRRAVLTQIFDFLSPEKVDKWVHTAFIQSPQLAARLINITDTHALFS